MANIFIGSLLCVLLIFQMNGSFGLYLFGQGEDRFPSNRFDSSEVWYFCTFSKHLFSFSNPWFSSTRLVSCIRNKNNNKKTNDSWFIWTESMLCSTMVLHSMHLVNWNDVCSVFSIRWLVLVEHRIKHRNYGKQTKNETKNEMKLFLFK